MCDSEDKLLPLVVILGPPGVGKGTLCKALSSTLGLHHLSVGDFCRTLSRGEQVTGMDACPPEVEECLRTNNPVPGEVLLPLLRQHLNAVTMAGEHKAIIVDGFPRSRDQQRHFEEALTGPVLVLSLQCPRSIAQQRYLGRKAADRPGEDAALFDLRTDKHVKQSTPVDDVYREKGVLKKVDVSGSLNDYVDRVAELIQRALGLKA